MITLLNTGAYLIRNEEVIPDQPGMADLIKSKTGKTADRTAASKETMSYSILQNHNTSGNMEIGRAHV